MKLNSFGIWFKEFVVNVFVQAFHAATYVTVVNIGLSAYTKSGDWLFFIICVLFLFQGEKIIRAIFNAQSSAGTIGDMAASGALALGALKSASKLFDGKGKSKNGDDDNDGGNDNDETAKNNKAKDNRERAKQALNANASTQGAEKNKAATEGDGTGGADKPNGDGTDEGSSPDSDDGEQLSDETKVKLGRETPTSHQEVFKSVNSRIDKQESNKKKHPALKLGADMAKKFGGFAFRNATGFAASMLSGTFALAQRTDSKSTGQALATAAAGYSAGKKFGQKVVDSVAGVYDRAKERSFANKLAEEYENGEHDEDFAINEADEQLRKQKLAAYRRIAAKIARDRAKYGKDVAEKMFIHEELHTTK